MHRRDLLKGLAAVPLASGTRALASLCTTSVVPVPGAFQVVFDGPFSIVLLTTSANRDDIASVVAFTPKEKNDQHQFKFNGVPLTLKQNHFTLAFSSFNTPTQPKISSDYAGFCTDHTRWINDDSKRFVTVSLPCPNRIVGNANVLPLPVQVHGQPNALQLPQAHILEYDVDPSATITMSYAETGLIASPVGNMFVLEVGMVPHSDPQCNHAKTFYNEAMLPFFPDLAGNTIDSFVNCPTTFVGRKYSSTIKIKDQAPIPVQTCTTTLECKSGGLIVTTP